MFAGRASHESGRRSAVWGKHPGCVQHKQLDLRSLRAVVDYRQPEDTRREILLGSQSGEGSTLPLPAARRRGQSRSPSPCHLSPEIWPRSEKKGIPPLWNFGSGLAGPRPGGVSRIPDHASRENEYALPQEKREGVFPLPRRRAYASEAAPAGVGAGAPPPLPRRRRRRRPGLAGPSPLASAAGSSPMNSMAASGAPSPIR